MTARTAIGTALLAATGLLAACGGSGNGTSIIMDTLPQDSGVSVLAYQESSESQSENHFKWYSVDRYGVALLLDDVSTQPEYDLTGYRVSPDSTQIAYWYQSESAGTTLTALPLDAEQSPPYSISLTGVLSPPLLWLPDSTGFVYTVRSAFQTHTLFLVRVDEENPLQLLEATLADGEVLDYAVSADGSKVSVSYSAMTAAGNALSLYLIDLKNPGEATLIERVSTDAYHTMRMDLAWSPYTSEFVYHAVSAGSTPPPPGMSSVAPSHQPFVLYRENAPRQILTAPLEYAPVSWVSVGHLKIDFDSRFDIVQTSGGPQLSHTTRPGSRSVASPDGRRVAFLDDTAAATAQVHVLDVASGQALVVGQGSSHATGIARPTVDSQLSWSADGGWLVWDQVLDFNAVPELREANLYAYGVANGTTRLITGALGSTAPRPSVIWLPDGNVLNYLVRSVVGYELTITDLASEMDLVVGDMAQASCGLLRTWPSNREVLWNRCGDGVYQSLIDESGSVVGTRLLGGDMASLADTASGQIVLMQRTTPGREDPPDAANLNWRLYDVTGQRLHELPNTSGVPCCGSLSQ